MRELFTRLGIPFDNYIQEHNLRKLVESADLVDINSNARTFYFKEGENYLKIRVNTNQIITGSDIVKDVNNILIKKAIVNKLDELTQNPENYSKLIKLYQECL